MHKIIIIIGLIATTYASAQVVAIEKTSYRSTSSILEFRDVVEDQTNFKGIILPIVDNIYPAPEQGTIYVSKDSKTVVYRSANGTVSMTPAYENIASSSLDDNGEGTVITDGSIPLSVDTAPAALKLLSNNKALILPHVVNVSDIVNPEIGTIVYEQNSKSLAIYNGQNWSFWN